MKSRGKTIGIMQPTYLPWLGYFELIVKSDIFVLLDDVQFKKKSWQQRNRIKGVNGELWLTVPVLHKGMRFQKIEEALINNSTDWARKHQKSIESSYGKSPFFNEVIPEIRSLYERKWEKLVDLNVALIEFFMQRLRIQTPILRSSTLEIASTGNLKILDICRGLDGAELYDTAGADVFIDAALFVEAGIRVTYQSYVHPVYSQLHGSFVPFLSIVDLLFNMGPRSLEIVRSGAEAV